MKKTTFTILCLLVGAAQAQAVWRCGPDGRSYVDSPCRDGRSVAVEQSRPTADVQQAQLMARREQALAVQLAKERQRREALAPAAPVGIHGSRFAAAPAPALSSKAKAAAKGKRRLEADGTWRAVVPVSRRAKD